MQTGDETLTSKNSLICYTVIQLIRLIPQTANKGSVQECLFNTKHFKASRYHTKMKRKNQIS